MDIFEYIAVLISIIIGLGVTQLLRGLVRLIQNPSHYRTYWVHLLWVAIMFFNMVFWWWWEFRLGNIETWSFFLYSFVVLYAFVFYLACALLFPEDIRDYDGFRDYFYSRRRWFFGLLAFSLFLDIGDSWLKGSEHFTSLGMEYAVATLAKLALFVTAAVVRNERFHSLFAIIFLAYQVFWAIRMFETIA